MEIFPLGNSYAKSFMSSTDKRPKIKIKFSMPIMRAIFNIQISRQNRRGVIGAKHFNIARNYC
ncbi:MAG: hypothetical protein VXW88_03545, partial [Pseudomonadota bacterium]|nr:hypothetical protein [Pseudomonadota bacterium]